MMASFLSKVLGRKKGDDSDSQKRRSNANLLDGPFEDVSPNVSPSIGTFPESQAEEIRGRESAGTVKGKGIFRSKSRSRARSPPVRRLSEQEIPHLSLSLNSARDYKGFDALFEVDPDASVTLSDTVLGKKRLSPEEALALIQACARAIVERGLETLGIMHPHWHSASIDVQRKLISLYILSLTPSPSNAAQSAFDSELTYARDPHDVAAVFRWALRHLLLTGSTFGSSDNWYQAFAEAEHAQSYPPRAFSDALVPLLPGPHRSLLDTALDLFESLSAHSEANGFSGSRLSKFLGLWLLTVERSQVGDDWRSFYERWEVAGRQLEHIFLARIRDAAAIHPVPKRLTDLVRAYPYGKASPTDLLPRPRFSTRTYVALLVRVDTEYTTSTAPIPHAFNTISKSLSAAEAENAETTDELRGIWTALKQAAAGEDGLPVLANVFSDATVRLLSLLPSAPPATDRSFALTAFDAPRSPPLSPTLSLTNETGPPSAFSRTVSTSMSRTTSNATAATSTAAPETPADWKSFTSAGFTTGPGSRLASTLFDTDVQRTEPPSPPLPVSRRSSRRANGGKRLSFDVPSATKEAVAKEKEEEQEKSKIALLAKVALDEAFVDFWTDAVLDGISTDWPRFVLAELRPLPAFALPSSSEPVSFVVLEQAFVRPPKPAPPPEAEKKEEVKEEPVAEVKEEERKERSPRPSLAENTRFSLSKRRFPFFAEKEHDAKRAKEKEGKKESKEKGKEAKHKRRASKTPKVGELGEVVKEEEEGKKEKETKKDEQKAAELVAAGVGAVAAGAAVAAGVAEEAGPSAEAQPAAEASQPEPEIEAEAEAETPVVADGAPVVDVPTERLVESDAPEPVAVEPVKFDETPAPEAPSVDGPSPQIEAPSESEAAAPEPFVEEGEIADVPDTVVPDAPVDASTAEGTVVPAISASQPVESEPQTAVPVDEHVEVPVDTNGESLPAAPAQVVADGETVGPALALETSEPVAQAEAAEPEVAVDEIVVPDEPAVVEAQDAVPEANAVEQVEEAPADVATEEEPIITEDAAPAEERPPSPVAEVLDGLVADAAVEEVAPDYAEPVDEPAVAALVEAPEEPAVEAPAEEAPQLDVSAPAPEEVPLEAEAEAAALEPELAAPEPEAEVVPTEPDVDVVAEPEAESADLPGSTSEADGVVEEPQTAADTVLEKSVVVEPTAEEPVAEEPAVEEPVAEEPVAEEPAIPEPVAQEPNVEDAPAEETVVASSAEETVPSPAPASRDYALASEPEPEPIASSVPIVEATPVNEALVQAAEDAVSEVQAAVPAPVEEEIPPPPGEDPVPLVEHVENVPAEVAPDVDDVATIATPADAEPVQEQEQPIEPAAPIAVDEEVQPPPAEDAVPDVEDVIPPTAEEEPEAAPPVEPESEAAQPVEPEPAQSEEPEPPVVVEDEAAADEERVPTPIPEDEVPVEHVASDPELAPLQEEPASTSAAEEAPVSEEALEPPAVEDTVAPEIPPVVQDESTVEDAAIPEDTPASVQDEESVPEPPAEAHIPVEDEADAEESQPTVVPTDEATAEEPETNSTVDDPEPTALADDTVDEQAIATPVSDRAEQDVPAAAPVEDEPAAEDIPVPAHAVDAVPVKDESEGAAEPLSPSAEAEAEGESDEVEPATPATPTAGEPTSPTSKSASAKKKGKKSKSKRK